MPQLQLEFSRINESLQVGDTAYYTTSMGSSGQFTTGSVSNIIAFGIVTSFNSTSIPCLVYVSWDDGDYDNDGNPDIMPPSQGDYIFFGKNNAVNSSSLLGYYAEVKFVNNSNEEAELFAVGSEISESSK